MTAGFLAADLQRTYNLQPNSCLPALGSVDTIIFSRSSIPHPSPESNAHQFRVADVLHTLHRATCLNTCSLHGHSSAHETRHYSLLGISTFPLAAASFHKCRPLDRFRSIENQQIACRLFAISGRSPDNSAAISKPRLQSRQASRRRMNCVGSAGECIKRSNRDTLGLRCSPSGDNATQSMDTYTVMGNEANGASSACPASV